MANICEYKVMVKGKKNHCYAMLGALPKYDDNDIIREEGSFEDYTIVFGNTCRWTLGTKGYDGTGPDHIPDDPDEAQAEFDGQYWDYNMEAHSKMFDVEIWYNSADIDEMMVQGYGHCKDGKQVDYDYPGVLKLDCQDELTDEDDIADAGEVINRIAANLLKEFPKEKILEIMNGTDEEGNEWDDVDADSFSSRLFVLYCTEWMGEHPGDAVEGILEDYFEDEEDAEKANRIIWKEFDGADWDETDEDDFEEDDDEEYEDDYDED